MTDDKNPTIRELRKALKMWQDIALDYHTAWCINDEEIEKLKEDRLILIEHNCKLVKMVKEKTL